MDLSLQRGPWLAGLQFSLADLAHASYMTRFKHLGVDQVLSDRLGVLEWRERLFARLALKCELASTADARSSLTYSRRT